jgi:hypothetical protein
MILDAMRKRVCFLSLTDLLSSVLLRISAKLSQVSASFAMRRLYGSQFGWTPSEKHPSFVTGKLSGDRSSFLPWFTYPAIAQLNRLGLLDQRILEFGCGSSTMYFLGQCIESIVSVEDSSAWRSFVLNAAAGDYRLKVLLRDSPETYALTIQELESISPNVILIDGNHRLACAKSIAAYLEISTTPKPWLVILDNSDWHGHTYQVLSRMPGFAAFDYYGYGPINSYSWCTTLFVRTDSNEFVGRQSGLPPCTPLATGLPKNWDPNL